MIVRNHLIDDPSFRRNGSHTWRLKDIPVADRAHGFNRNPVSRIGLSTVSGSDFHLYRTACDRTPARSVVTAEILGDPKPGRSAQDDYERRQAALGKSTSS